MTITLFITILTLAATLTSLVTEAVKKSLDNDNIKYSANLVVAIIAVIIGCGGTAVTYILMNIPWTLNNIICLVLMGGSVWLGSMVGYDKVMQLISQIAQIKE